MAQHRCYGYDTGSNGELAVNPDETAVVRWIFNCYLSGDSLSKNVAGLEELGIPSHTGKPKWSREALNKLLSNEKYIGQVQMQKTFTADFLTGRREKNIGQLASLRISGKDEEAGNVPYC